MSGPHRRWLLMEAGLVFLENETFQQLQAGSCLFHIVRSSYLS
jgi:hypothetical protein